LTREGEPLSVIPPTGAHDVIDTPARHEHLDLQASIIEDPRLLLAAIIDSSEDAIISKGLNGIITTWNNAAQKKYGYSAEEIIGPSILRLIPRELRAEEDEILRKLRAGQRLEHYETTRVTKDGQRIDVSLTISPIKDASGRVIGSSKIALNF
jgi:PAS domain S-box-containing protein